MFVKNNRIIKSNLSSVMPFIGEQFFEMVSLDVLSHFVKSSYYYIYTSFSESEKEAVHNLYIHFRLLGIHAIPCNYVLSGELFNAIGRLNEEKDNELLAKLKRIITYLKEYNATFFVKVMRPQFEYEIRRLGEFYGKEKVNVQQHMKSSFDGWLYRSIHNYNKSNVKLFGRDDSFFMLSHYFNYLPVKKFSKEDLKYDFGTNESLVFFVSGTRELISVKSCDHRTPIGLSPRYYRFAGLHIYKGESDIKEIGTIGRYRNVFIVTTNYSLEEVLFKHVISHYKDVDKIDNIDRIVEGFKLEDYLDDYNFAVMRMLSPK